MPLRNLIWTQNVQSHHQRCSGRTAVPAAARPPLYCGCALPPARAPLSPWTGARLDMGWTRRAGTTSPRRDLGRACLPPVVAPISPPPLASTGVADPPGTHGQQLGAELGGGGGDRPIDLISLSRLQLESGLMRARESNVGAVSGYLLVGKLAHLPVLSRRE